MHVRGHAEDDVVRPHLVPIAHRLQLDHVLLRRQREGELALLRISPLGPVDQSELPDQFSPLEPEAVECPAGDQVLDDLPLHPRPLDEIEQRAEWATTLAFILDVPRALLLR